MDWGLSEWVNLFIGWGWRVGEVRAFFLVVCCVCEKLYYNFGVGTLGGFVDVGEIEINNAIKHRMVRPDRRINRF